MNKAVFIDRDGVINNDEGHYYIFRKEDFRLNEGILEGLKLLRDHGYKIVIVTNQGGVAKGEYTEQEVNAVHTHLTELLQKEHITLDGIYYCPHHDKIMDCECRKPKPGMILKALDDLKINPDESYLIGDSARDIEAGKRAGLKQCFQIESNHSIVPLCQMIVKQ